MHRGWCANVIGTAAFAVEGKPNGRGYCAVAVVEDVPDLRFLDAVVPGGPHLDASLVAPIESVRHDAVLAGRTAGRHVGLNRASDGREARIQDRVPAPDEQAREVRHRRQITCAKSGNRQQNDKSGHSIPALTEALAAVSAAKSNKSSRSWFFTMRRSLLG